MAHPSSSVEPHKAPVPPSPDAPIKAWALYYHSLGLHPLPVMRGGHPWKRPALDSWVEYQTRQPTLEEIEGWDWSGGVGITPAGLVVVDFDGEAGTILDGRPLPASWTVETGGGGLHRYYSANGQRCRNGVRILKGENGAGMDTRAQGGFVVAPPTIHQDSGKRYKWLLAPGGPIRLVPAPEWILDAVKEPEPPQQQTPRAEFTNGGDVIRRARAYLAKIPPAIEGQGGDTHTLSTACKVVRGFALDEEEAVGLLLEWNAGCQPPWTEREIRQKVANALKYGTEPMGHLRDAERPRGEQRASARAESQEETRIEELPAEAPESDLPPFPQVAYQGLTAEVAQLYAETIEAPQAFLYMDALTFLGALIAPHVRLDSALREETRLYVVKVGPSWSSRKSSSQDMIEHHYEPLLRDRVTMCYGTGSAEGLANRMKSGLPALLVYDEFRSFVDKSGVQQSVLLPMVASLFSRTVYENATRASEIRLMDAHLSLVGACTTETFTTMFTPQFRNIGFLNRLFVVAGKRTTLKPLPGTASHETVRRLQERILAQVEQAKREKPALRFTTEARVRWEEWYRAMPETPYAARLDTYGLRLLMLFAVTTESWQITRPLVDAVIPLLDYELAVRRELDPVDAEGVVARLERLILRHLRKGRMTGKRLRDLCNVQYYGLWVFDQAWGNLRRQGWVKEAKSGRGVNLWLTEAGCEAATQ